MGRYDQWRALKGDTDSPELFDLGKKLLGFLAEQRRLSGVSTTAILNKTADGSLVRARFVGDFPMIEVSKARNNLVPAVKLALLRGLVAQPRSFAAADAFGDYPEAVLSPTADTWQNYLYDDSYLASGAASGYYSVSKNGAPLFADGLPSPDYTGWIDWRNADESVALCWLSSVSRYFQNDSYDPFAEEGIIYYNGKPLFNIHDDLPGTEVGRRYVGGAALHGKKLLLAVIEQIAAGELADYYFRFYMATVKADTTTNPWFSGLRSKIPGLKDTMCPSMVIDDAAVQVAEFYIPTQNGWPPARFFFNQSADECRSLVSDYDFYSGAGNDSLRVREFVVDWRAYLADPDDPVTITDTEIHHIQQHQVEQRVYEEVRLNAINGTYTAPLGDTTYMLDKPFDIAVVGGTASVMPIKGEYTLLIEYTEGGSQVDWYRVAVDYQDNVPVYLWSQPDIVATSVVYDGAITGQESRPDAGLYPVAFTVAASREYTEDRTGSRGTGLKAVDKDGNTWLQVTCARSRAYTYSGTSDTDVIVDPPSTMTGTGQFSYTSSYNDVDEKIAVYFLDLRSRSAAYTKVTTETQIDLEHESVGTPDSDSTFDMASTHDETQDVTFTAETKVLFFGTEEATYNGTRTDSLTNSFTGNETLGYGDVRELGWLVAGFGGGYILPLFDDTYYLANGGDGTPPFPDWDTPLTDYPTDDVEDFTAPEGGTYDATEIQSACGGTWPWSKNAPAYSVMVGAWNTYGNGWVYSMADLSDDISDEKWISHISGDLDDVDSFTGGHGLDSIGQIWPMSLCIRGADVILQGP